MKKYRTDSWGNSIKAVEIEKESRMFVWIKGSRTSKRSKYDNYFDTWIEAKAFLVDLASRRVASLTTRLGNAKIRLDEICSLPDQDPTS